MPDDHNYKAFRAPRST